MTRFRLMFEPHLDVIINDPKLFEHYARNYLDEFPVEWGGSIAMSQMEKNEERLEPVWQLLIPEGDENCKTKLLSYLDKNPMEGYWVHVYEESGNGESAKIH